MTPEWVLLGLRVLGAAALYSFLGLMAVLLWKDLRQSARRSGPIPSAHLVSARNGEGTGARHPLTDVNTLGRAADNTIRLTNERVSAHHARLAYQGGQWMLEDLGSTNGTRVNGVPIEQPLVVTYGDTLSLGDVDLVLRAGGEVGVVPPSAPGVS